LDDLKGDGIHYIVPLKKESVSSTSCTRVEKILKRLREKGLTNKIPVGEVLFELSKVTKIVETSGREYFAKIPNPREQNE
jgi:hypothetical protein